MPDQTAPRAALYVDFDNVFLSLARWDERAGYAFGERPDLWLAWLEGREGGNGPTTRRTLIRRCYLNPGGSFDFPYGGPVARHRAARDQRNRAYFSEFRANFVAAGFDVVDCPPVAYLKNTADMRMALDIREALDHPTRFDEFVLLSSDSDFLPTLARLRAFDRRVTIVAQGAAKRAYLAAADHVVALDEFAESGLAPAPVIREAALAPPAAPPRAVIEPPPAPPPAELRGEVLRTLRDALASRGGRLPLTQVGSSLAREFPELRRTSYAGAGSLVAFVEAANDPRLAIAGTPPRLWLYDPEAGPAPVDEAPLETEEPAAPETEAPAGPVEGFRPAPVVPPAEAAPPPPARDVEVVSAAPDTAAPTDARMAEVAAVLRDLFWGSRDARGLPEDLPALSAEELAFVLAATAARQPLAPEGGVTEAATGIAAEAAGRGLLVSPREVTEILRWLARGYVKLFEPPPPAEAALRLGRVLYTTLVNRVLAVGERLSEAEKAALRGWTQARLEAETAQGP